ncbi:toprim domain-containing protein [Nocardia abscessus]|uniref:toprim domain-containing protein n=1 Tax=Nocardia abscessus TaxID=120957 RepID=UPI002454B656|nr:toprim domain-containing protein [Nocardia abscessus]
MTTRKEAQDEIDRFRLGYVEDPLLGHEMYKGHLAIPYLRWSQEYGWSVVAIRFRCIEDHDCKKLKHGKYLTEAGDRPRLYNTLALLRPSPIIAITEGEIDAITAQVCGVPAVGVPGATSWQPHFREPFLGYRTVYILTDGDDPGMQFGNVVAKSLPNAKILPSPPGEDVNSIVRAEGPKALRERIS